MRPNAKQPLVSKSWGIALLIGLVFVALGYGVRFEIETVSDPVKRSSLDLTLFLCGYLFVFCLQPIQKAILRKLRQRAAQRAASRLGARPVPTCEVPVLFSAELAGGLFGSFLGAISGGNLYRKSSFLEGAIGQKLFPEWLTIDERPHLMRAMGSSAFDGDGLATYAKPFVEKGELVSYVLGTYAGRKLGLPSTANSGGVHNLFVTHGDEDQAALLRRMGRGLLVTELMGSGLNMVTGDYSRGAAGFWVENGEIQFAVQEVTIAGNMRDMFKQIVAVGNDLELRSNIRTGSVLIERMTVAGS